MFYVAIFFAVLCSFLSWLLWQTNKLHASTISELNEELMEFEKVLVETEEQVELYWNRSEGYRSNADIFKAERDDALRCLDVVLTEQAERISRELDDAYDSLSMVLAENEKLRVA